MPVSFGGFGGSTKSPFGPLNVCTTPTEGFLGSPTTAIGIVTTPLFATGRTDSGSLVLVLDDDPPQAAAPTDSAPSRATTAIRWQRIGNPLSSLVATNIR